MGEGSEPVLFDQPGWKVPSGYFCYRCGYDLQGLSRPDRCPECGLSVEDSLKSDEIAFGMRRASWVGTFGVVFGIGYVVLFLWHATAILGALRAGRMQEYAFAPYTLATLALLAHVFVGVSHMMAASTLRMPHNRGEADRVRTFAGLGIIAAIVVAMLNATSEIAAQFIFNAVAILLIGIRNTLFVSLVSHARGARSPVMLVILNSVTIGAAALDLLARLTSVPAFANVCSMLAAISWITFNVFWPLMRARVGKPKLKPLRD